MCDRRYIYIIIFVIGTVTCEQELNRNGGTNIASSSIVLTNVIYRHGDRTPIDPYPMDPYRNLSYWPVGWGQLTNTGKEQHYELGQWLRNRYSGLLPAIYAKEDILVRSTDVDRTLMSAESNLAGLYPPTPPQQWNKNVMWQPIPIHTMPETNDEVLAAKKPCPSYDWELRRVKNSPEMQKVNKDNAALYDYITAHSGKDVHDIQGVEYVFNTLFIESLNNFSLPAWTKSVYPSKLTPLAALSFSVPAMTKQLQRLKSGPLLGEIIQHMKHKAKDNLVPNRKMFMYSAHDTTFYNTHLLLSNSPTLAFSSRCSVKQVRTAGVKASRAQEVVMTDSPEILTVVDNTSPLWHVIKGVKVVEAAASLIANMLMTLGVFDLQNPPYTSTILIELRKIMEGDFVVAVWYRNVTGREPYLLTLPGCTALCPLGQFVRLTEPVIPIDWQQECQQTMILFTPDGLAFNPTSLIGLIGLGVVAILLVICSLIGIVHVRQRRATSYSYHRLPASHNI